MKDLRDIFSALSEIRSQGKTCVLATVVNVQGSAYRHPGARLLVKEEGSTVGMVSSGCLEADICERARLLFEKGGRELVTYNLTDEGDIVWGTGLGCAGIIDVLLSYLSEPEDYAPYVHLGSYGLTGRTSILTTVFRATEESILSAGDSVLLQTDGSVDFVSTDSKLGASITADIPSLLEKGNNRVLTFDLPEGSVDALVEIIQPPVQLVVFGAGYDAIPVVQFAKTLGWDVTVLDSRHTYATRERFPDADNILTYWNAADVGSLVELSSHTVAVVMTHQYLQDREFLKLLLSSQARYIGLLGPRSRTDQLFEDLRDQGFVPSAERMTRVYAPIGLNIGTETAEEVALSIISEIQAVLSDRVPIHLKDFDGPLHDTR